MLMNASIRYVFAFAIAIPLVVWLVGLRLGLDLLDVGQSLRAARRLQELNQFLNGSIRHQAEQRVLAKEVISQRCSLQEALEQMHERNREWLREMEDRWPDLSRDVAMTCRREWSKPDWYYQRLTAEIENLFLSRPEEATPFLRRLDKEYQRLQAEKATPLSREAAPAKEGRMIGRDLRPSTR
jgi:hypothetical protein